MLRGWVADDLRGDGRGKNSNIRYFTVVQVASEQQFNIQTKAAGGRTIGVDTGQDDAEERVIIVKVKKRIMICDIFVLKIIYNLNLPI